MAQPLAGGKRRENQRKWWVYHFSPIKIINTALMLSISRSRNIIISTIYIKNSFSYLYDYQAGHLFARGRLKRLIYEFIRIFAIVDP